MHKTPEKHTWYSLHGEPHEEYTLIQSLSKTTSQPWQIVTRNESAAQYLTSLLQKDPDISSVITIPPRAWVSPQAVFDALESTTPIDRKSLICLIRMGFWLVKTSTWLLHELKWYGPEREYHALFITREDEWHRFRAEYHAQYQQAKIRIYTPASWQPDTHLPLMLRDAALLEWGVRMSLSEKIRIHTIQEDIQILGGMTSEKLMRAIEWIAALYDTLPDRPAGNAPYPPGKYGETYSLSQKDIWTRWGVYLVLITKKLENAFFLWKQEQDAQTHTHEDTVRYTRTIHALSHLIKFHLYTSGYHSVVISLSPDALTLHLLHQHIPKSYIGSCSPLIGYGYGIDTPMMRSFLEREWHQSALTFSAPSRETTSRMSYKNTDDAIISSKTLILTTSMRHIRELGAYYEHYAPLLQGISWGKSKIQHYFQHHSEKNILIGLIDTWKDAFNLFPAIDQIIVAKIPFDPPTDPYFLAKTQWMSRNFETYSTPIVCAKLNTLMGNYFSVQPQGTCVCIDPRIKTSMWGKSLLHNLL